MVKTSLMRITKLQICLLYAFLTLSFEKNAERQREHTRSHDVIMGPAVCTAHTCIFYHPRQSLGSLLHLQRNVT